jgi:hypothetical protein
MISSVIGSVTPRRAPARVRVPVRLVIYLFPFMKNTAVRNRVVSGVDLPNRGFSLWPSNTSSTPRMSVSGGTVVEAAAALRSKNAKPAVASNGAASSSVAPLSTSVRQSPTRPVMAVDAAKL